MRSAPLQNFVPILSFAISSVKTSSSRTWVTFGLLLLITTPCFGSAHSRSVIALLRTNLSTLTAFEPEKYSPRFHRANGGLLVAV